MADPVEQIRHSLVERIRRIIDVHRAAGLGSDAESTCSCGAESLSDHPRHLAEQIVDGLALKPADIDEVKKRIRYASAWFNWELTKLEGAEC